MPWFAARPGLSRALRPAWRDAESARAHLDKSAQRIAGMFDAIAPRYDLLNTVLSAGLDRYWRRRAIASLRFTGRETLVDVCTVPATSPSRRPAGGAGARGGRSASTLPVRCWSAPATRAMRGACQPACRWSAAMRCRCPSEQLRRPCHHRLRDQERRSSRGGVRGVAARATPAGACGYPRVRPARRSRGTSVYMWYFRNVLPRIGRAVSRHDAAYSYLPASVNAFPWGDTFAQMLRKQGFNNVEARPLSLRDRLSL